MVPRIRKVLLQRISFLNLLATLPQHHDHDHVIDSIMNNLQSYVNHNWMSGDILESYQKVVGREVWQFWHGCNTPLSTLLTSYQSCYHPTELLQVFAQMELTRLGWKWRFSLEDCVLWDITKSVFYNISRQKEKFNKDKTRWSWLFIFWN